VAAFDLFRSQQTSDPLMVSVLLAKRINALLGGMVVSPWNVGELPQEWIDAVLILEGNNVLNRSWQKVEDKFAEFRRLHGRE